jgi:hypothetical protein
MSRPLLLDLFSGAEMVKSRCANYSMCILRCSSDDAAAHSQILLDRLRTASRARLAEKAQLPGVRCGIRGPGAPRRQSATLLERVCKEPQCEERPGVDRRAPGGDENVQVQLSRQKSRGRAQAMADSAESYPRSSRRKMRCVWSVQPVLASRGLHPNREEQSVPTPPSLQIRVRTPRPIPHSLRKPPLRIDSYRPHRRDGHNTVGVAP